MIDSWTLCPHRVLKYVTCIAAYAQYYQEQLCLFTACTLLSGVIGVRSKSHLAHGEGRSVRPQDRGLVQQNFLQSCLYGVLSPTTLNVCYASTAHLEARTLEIRSKSCKTSMIGICIDGTRVSMPFFVSFSSHLLLPLDQLPLRLPQSPSSSLPRSVFVLVRTLPFQPELT